MKKFYAYINGEDKKIPEEMKIQTEQSLSSIIQKKLEARLQEAIKGIKGINGTLPVNVVRSRGKQFGDFSTNCFFKLAKIMNINVNVKEFEEICSGILEKSKLADLEVSAQIKGGYVNFTAIGSLSEKLKEEAKEQQKKKSSPEEEKKQLATKHDYEKYFKEFLPNDNPSPAHKYSCSLHRAMFTPESFQVFKQYEQAVHKKKDKSKQTYERFLCQSSLYDSSKKEEAAISAADMNDPDTHRTFKDEGVNPKALGSYHLYHRIDGELMAVSVLDITPHSVSSVYLFYNPKFDFLLPGKVCAIREIEYILKLRELGRKEMEYYMMGFYVQTCQKMRYKGEYKPSELVCPVTYQYVKLDKRVKKLIQEKGGAVQLSQTDTWLPDMDWKTKQILDFVNNFKFYHPAAAKQLTLDALNPLYRDLLGNLIQEIALVLGKQLSESIKFKS